MKDFIREAFNEAEKVQQNFLTDDNVTAIEAIAEAVAATFQNGNKVLICGNGGSNCDAMHFAEEFTGRFRKERKALPVLALADPSHITCVGNDYGFEEVFARGVEAFGQPGDMFIGISTSGNSANILKGLQVAAAKGLQTCGLLGKDGGRCKDWCQSKIIVAGATTDRIQEMHIKILHIIIEMVERKLFPDNY